MDKFTHSETHSGIHMNEINLAIIAVKKILMASAVSVTN